MQVKFKGCRTGKKINISMVIPTGEQKTVITMEMPQGGDWRADIRYTDKADDTIHSDRQNHSKR